MTTRMRDYERYQQRRRRFAILRAIGLWAVLIVLCLFTLLGVWDFFVLLLSVGR